MAERNMMLTMDEYLGLRMLLGTGLQFIESSAIVTDSSQETKPKRRRSRGAKASDKKMSKALAQANAELRKVNGDLRKGVTQGDIMTRAHRIKKTL